MSKLSPVMAQDIELLGRVARVESEVKISRKLLERVVRADASKGASATDLVDGWRAMEQIRAILAATQRPQGDERGHDTKGSRKALGAMNAKLKAKIGRLERELAAYQRAQQPQSAEAVAFVKESQYLLGDTSDEISELLPTGMALYTTPQPGAGVVMPDARLLGFATSRWHAEVANRPLVNVHRRALDDTWRQVIRFAGGDPDALCGPSHDELVARLNGKEVGRG